MARAGARLTPSVNALLRHFSGWDELNEILSTAETKKGRRLWVTASVSPVAQPSPARRANDQANDDGTNDGRKHEMQYAEELPDKPRRFFYR
jgi:hypothetical protein